MAKNTNSASRVLALLTSIPHHSDNTQVLEVWTALFNINDKSTNKRAVVVSNRLNAIHRELETINHQMDEANFSKELYEPSTLKIEQAISTVILGLGWNQARQHLNNETLLALAFCREIIPDEETEINDDDFSEIRTQLNELQALLENSILPVRLQKLIQHHIEIIQTALAEYPISGAKALRRAAHSAVGEIIEAREEIKENRDAPEISKLQAVWKKVNQTTDIALKTDKVAELGQKAWSMIESIITNSL